MASIECGTADLNLAKNENGVKVLTVNTPAVTKDSKILLTYTSQSTGFLSVGDIVPGTSFQIVSSNQADTSSVNWLVVNNVGTIPGYVSDLLSSAPVNAVMTSAPVTALCSAVVPSLTKSSIWSALTCKKRGPPVVPASAPVNVAPGALTVVRSVDVSGSAVDVSGATVATVDAVVAVVEPTAVPTSSS
jgi:hypothetical protein